MWYGFGDFVALFALNSDVSNNLFPPRAKFNPDRDIPDMTGKVVLVTGGNIGIGYQTAYHLLKHNATVYLGCRSPTRGDAAIAKLRQATGKTAKLIELDLSDLHKVRQAADALAKREDKLDLLICNAGIMGSSKELTAQGHDLTFGVAVLGHYFLTKLLTPLLAEAANPRIINYSSALAAQAVGDGINFATLTAGPERDAVIKSYGGQLGAGMKLYSQAKLGNIVASHLANELNPKFQSCSLHPGILRSELVRDMNPILRGIATFLSYPIQYGPLTALYAATTPDSIAGKYFYPWGRVGKADPRGDSEKLRSELKEWLDAAITGF